MADPLYAGLPLSAHLLTIYGPGKRINNPAKLSVKERASLSAQESRRTTSRNQLTALLAPTQTAKGPLRVGSEAVPFITNWAGALPLDGWRLSAAHRVAHVLPNIPTNKARIAWQFLYDFPIAIEDPELVFFSTGLTNRDRWVQRWAAAALGRHVEAGMRIERDKALRVLFPLSSYADFPQTDAEKHYFYAGGVGRPLSDQIRTIIDRMDPGRDVIPLYMLEFGLVAGRVGAADELARNPRYAARAVPLLTANLSATNRAVIERCASALGAFGADALPSLADLQPLLDHPRERIRRAASNSIVAIKSEHPESGRVP